MRKLPWLPLLCLLVMQHSAHGKELGRLFFTPEQRRMLESGHFGAGTENQSSTVVVNGIVQRSGGRRTVWINGIPLAGGPSNGQNPAAAPVRLPGKSRSVQLKVGQKLLLDQPAPAAPEAVSQQGGQ